jgi:hypothetical protein
MAYFDRKDDYNYIRWAKEVKLRDHFTCVVCGCQGEWLESHHLNAWSSFPSERYDLENGVTLCKFHHDNFHERYGKGGNTREQFEEYKSLVESVIKVAKKSAIVDAASKKMLQQVERDIAVQEIMEELEADCSEDGYGLQKFVPTGVQA